MSLLDRNLGLASQKYNFETDVQGRERIYQTLNGENASHGPSISLDDTSARNWRRVFQNQPRIRFNGVYISTVNYTRAGGASATQATWSNPVHVVTYYRYLRFFRDGTVISLLASNEPTEVVYHLTKDNLALVKKSGKGDHPLNFVSSAHAIASAPSQSIPPSATNLMKHAHHGRWRLSHPFTENSKPEVKNASVDGREDGDVHIETEGVGPRYLYTMHLVLRSSSKAKHTVKNNKLQWKGFWCYNQLSHDWAEFGLKNDRAFLFHRVKSYGRDE